MVLGHHGPLLLRPVGGGQFLFRGFTCVNGVMRGEALVEARAKLLPELDKENYNWLSELAELEPDELPFDKEWNTLI